MLGGVCVFNFLLKAICFEVSNCLFFHFLLTSYLFLKFFDRMNAKSNILVFFFLLFNT